MALFELDTDIVTNSSEKCSSLAKEVSAIGETVSSFDVSNEDNFSFAAARQAIVDNINACAIKLSNSSVFLDGVVESHTKLQNETKFVDPAEKARQEEEKAKKQKEQKQDKNGGSPRWNPGPSGGSPTYNDVKKGSLVAPLLGTGIANTVDSSVNGTANVSVDFGNNIFGNYQRAIDNNSFNRVGYVNIDLNAAPEDTTNLFNDKDLSNQETGYYMIGSRYVISCDEDVGKVGDVIAFTKNDGTTVECVVGYNTVSNKYQDSINFIVDSSRESVVENDDSRLLLTDLKQIENKGPLSQIGMTGEGNSVLPPSNPETTELSTGSSSTEQSSTGTSSSPETTELSTGSSSTEQSSTGTSSSPETTELSTGSSSTEQSSTGTSSSPETTELSTGSSSTEQSSTGTSSSSETTKLSSNSSNNSSDISDTLYPSSSLDDIEKGDHE